MKKEEKDEYNKTYGIFKFKRPLPKEIIRAIGLEGESILYKKMIMGAYERFYDIIKVPEEGDWLMTHKEYGQTYKEYIQNGCIQVDQNHDIIYIAQLSFSANDGSFMSSRISAFVPEPTINVALYAADGM